MKYDVLDPFKEYIYKNLPEKTAKTYYAAVVKLFKEKQFDSLAEFDSHWLIENSTTKFKTRNEFSAVKNGLKWLARFDKNLQLPSEEEFKAVSMRKRNYSKKPKKVIYLKPTQRKINQLQNEKLKYAYRLALVSGLRVSELSDLEAKDISIQDGKLRVFVRKGKGGHGGWVECNQDEYLLQRLPEYLENHPEGKIFYSEAYMRQKASELGIECHDLRRIFAIQTRNEIRKGRPTQEANDIVQGRLRHARFSTTKRYLFNRKLKFEYEENTDSP